MSGRLRRLAALGLLIAGIDSALAAPGRRLFSIDDLLGNESIGEVRFDPRGRFLVLEYAAPYETGTIFDVEGGAATQGRTRVKRFDLGHPQGLTDVAAGAITASAMSPDGTRLLVRTRVADTVEVALVDSVSGSRRLLPVRLSLNSLSRPEAITWLSAEEVLLIAPIEGRAQLLFKSLSDPTERLAARSRRAWLNEGSSASVLGSGRHAVNVPEPRERLVRVNLHTLAVDEITRGDFIHILPSHSGRQVAAVRFGPYLHPRAGHRMEHRLQRNYIHRTAEVAVIDTGSRRETVVCPGCDVFEESVKWSGKSDRLALIARHMDEPWSEGHLYLYEPSKGAPKQLTYASVSIAPLSSAALNRYNARTAWVGDRLAFVGRPRGDAGARADWFVIDRGGAPVNLTAEFPETPQVIDAVSGNAAFIVSEGEAWRVEAGRARKNLTADLPSPVQLRDDGYEGTTSIALGADAPSPELVLKMRDAAGLQVVFLDPHTGLKRFVRAPGGDAELLAASASAGMAVFEHGAGSTGITLCDTRGGQTRLLELNEHLKDVKPSRVVKLSYAAGDGRTMQDWLLLPPDAVEALRYPLVVEVYPETVQPAEWPTHRTMASESPFNNHLLAAHGYAVLYPSLPMPPFGSKADPLVGLADRVVAAAQRAVDAGYADPERWGIKGQSFGGYSTLATIAATHRFKAAVASAAPTNFVSGYGGMDPKWKIAADEMLTLARPAIYEESQSRMGATPWQDLDRYVRNSPYFYADKIDTPVMLLQGSLDHVVMSQAEEMFTALYRHGRDAVLVRYWGEGHVPASPANIRDLWKRILDWYGLYLRP